MTDEELMAQIDKKMGGPPMNPEDFKDVVPYFKKKLNENTAGYGGKKEKINFERKFENNFFMEL